MKKTLLGVASGLSAAAIAFSFWANAAGALIKVTTLQDENGENSAACSLREAVKAVNTREPFGGCPAGALAGDNVIQLESGTYALDPSKGEIVLQRDVVLAGKTTWDWSQENPVTGTKPKRTRPTSIIKTAASSRLFNTESSSASINMRDVEIKGNGLVTGKGGLIFATSSINLDNVHIRDASSTEDGGAIYLAGNGVSLNAVETTFTNNHSDKKGGILAVSCSQDLSLLARHEITIAQSLLNGNSSDSGAGAIEVCGNSTVTVSNSTIAKNESATGAISYIQSIVPKYGVVALDSVTAVEQSVGGVLHVDNIASVTVASSILAWNAGQSCSFGVVPTSHSSMYNAQNDLSCLPLVNGGATTNNQTISNALTDQLTLLSDHGGLTDTYLPLDVIPSAILDKGAASDSCSGTDQRGALRNSGTGCDIGAVERLQATALPIIANNVNKEDRKAIVDVMSTARFGESDLEIYQLEDVLLPSPSDTSDTKFMYDATLYGGTSPVCAWHDSTETNEKFRRRLVVDTQGVVSGPTPTICQYKVKDTGGSISNPSDVTVDIKNAPPVAKSDTYVRPVGTQTITLDPTENDTDEGDGIYGQGAWWGSSLAPKDAYIYVAESNRPKLGKLTGRLELPCPDSTLSSPKVCFYPPLKYEANNSDSPFTDSFTYVVYDKEGSTSNSTIVTIKTDEPDPDKGETGGSFGLGSGLIMLLLGWRRFRRV